MGRYIGFALLAAALLYPLAASRLHHKGDAQVSLRDAANCPHALAMPTDGNVDDVREATLCLLNQERAREDLPALHREARLEAASQRHSEDMAERRYFSHETPGGVGSAQRMRRAGYQAQTTGENLAWGTGDEATPEHIVVGWMNSPGHRENILDPRFREIGVGVTPHPPRSLAGHRAATYTTDFGSGE